MSYNAPTLQTFKSNLINKKGYIVIVYPNHNFLDLIKRLTYEVLGEPVVENKYKWKYGDNKTIKFVLINHPSEEYRLWGIAREQIMYFSGDLADEFLGVQRTI